jgi:hypothetical protein
MLAAPHNHSVALPSKHAQPPRFRKPQGSQVHQLAFELRLSFPCRRKVGRHSRELGYKLLGPVCYDKGSSDFGLVICNMRLQLRDLRLQYIARLTICLVGRGANIVLMAP